MPLSLLLRCTSLAETAAFYRDVLGFATSSPDADPLAAEAHGAGLLFTALDLWERPPGASATLYFTVPDVDAYYREVAPKARLAWPLQEMPYGSREFALIDCNGYYVAFQQQM